MRVNLGGVRVRKRESRLQRLERKAEIREMSFEESGAGHKPRAQVPLENGSKFFPTASRRNQSC